MRKLLIPALVATSLVAGCGEYNAYDPLCEQMGNNIYKMGNSDSTVGQALAVYYSLDYARNC